MAALAGATRGRRRGGARRQWRSALRSTSSSRTREPSRLPTSPVRLPSAAVKYAAAHPDAGVPPHALRPIYIRRPDAELARDRAARRHRRTDARPVIRRATTPLDLAAVDRLQRQTFTNPWGAEAIRWELENTDVARLYVAEAPDRRARRLLRLLDGLRRAAHQQPGRGGRAGGSGHRATAAASTSSLTPSALAPGCADPRGSGIERRRARAVRGTRIPCRGRSRRDYYQDPREDALILWKIGQLMRPKVAGKVRWPHLSRSTAGRALWSGCASRPRSRKEAEHGRRSAPA